MKALGRSLVIILVSLLVCGITWGLGRSITVQGGGERRERPAVAGQTQQVGGEGFAPRGRPEGGSGFVGGLIAVGQPFAIIAVIVALGQGVLAWLRKRYPTPADRRKLQRTG